MRIRTLALLHILFALAALSQSDLSLVRTTGLHGDTHHPQGIDFAGRRLWVSSVDKSRSKGALQEFNLDTGECLRTVDVTSGSRFHPGGLSIERQSLWLPVAEYRRESSAVIQKRSLRTLEVEFSFEVPDHIGCIAASSDALVGANWDSRDFYIWDHTGRLVRKAPNPTENAYQDLKFVEGRMVGSGLLPGRTGAIDWLEYPSLRLIRRIAVDKTDRGVPFTNEGMATRGDQLLLLPEDSPSRLFRFRILTPAAAAKP